MPILIKKVGCHFCVYSSPALPRSCDHQRALRNNRQSTNDNFLLKWHVSHRLTCLNMGPGWSVSEGCGILRTQRLNGESESLGTEVLRFYCLARLPVLLCFLWMQGYRLLILTLGSLCHISQPQRTASPEAVS